MTERDPDPSQGQAEPDSHRRADLPPLRAQMAPTCQVRDEVQCIRHAFGNFGIHVALRIAKSEPKPAHSGQTSRRSPPGRA